MNADSLLGLLIDAAVKSTLVLAAALLMVRFGRRTPSAYRHAILAAGVIVALALPVTTAVLPQWRLAILPASHVSGARLRPVEPLLPTSVNDTAVALHSTDGPMSARHLGSSATPIEASNAPGSSIEPTSNWTWRGVVLLAWLCGAIVALCLYVVGYIGAIGLARAASPAGTELRQRFQRLARRMGIRRHVLLKVGGRAQAPMAMGILRPTVLLPTDAGEWPQADVDTAILHELAHVKRRDSVAQLIGWVGCAVYWANPLVWLVARQMLLERELACDDAVLCQDVEPAGYARLLVDVARALQSRWVPALPMARPSSLKERVRTILNESADRRPMRPRARALAAGAVVLISLGIAPLKFATRTALAAAPATTQVIAPRSVNAADLYLQATRILRDNDNKNIMCPAASALVYFGYPPYSKEWTAMEAADYPANAEARALAHQARSLDKADWPEEKKLPDGEFSLKYLDEIRNLANELGDAAMWEHLHEDDAHAIETIRDLLHLAALVRQTRHAQVISSLVSVGLDAAAMDRLNIIVSSVQLSIDPKESKKLSLLSAKTLMNELIAEQLDPEEFIREANAEPGVDHLKLVRSLNQHMQVTRAAVEMDMARLNLACHLYRHDHAAWPASLDDLQPYVSEIPVDRLGDGKAKIGYVVIKHGLPDGSDRPLLYSRYGSTGPLFYPASEPEYDFYPNTDPVTGKSLGRETGGQFRDVVGWSPADRDHVSPTTKPLE